MVIRGRGRIVSVVMRYVVGSVASGLLACAGRSVSAPPEPLPNAADAAIVRVTLGTSPSISLGAAGDWQLTDRDGRAVASGGPGDAITVSASRGGVDVTANGTSPRAASAPLSMAVQRGDAIVSVDGRRYRGALSIIAADSGFQILNRVPVEQYLRGVVPRELGTRDTRDRAALEAQAIAARSYVVTRLGNATRGFDVTATTSDQVYGGVGAENSAADAAVAATAGLVLMYNGRIVNAPYHSTCGGSTAAPSEVWGSTDSPYLRAVSDRIPGSDRSYCDIAPRFRWERSWRSDTLAAVVERYIRAYASVTSDSVGAIRSVEVDGHTASGRVATLWIETDRGRYRLQRNDIRYVLRSPGGELLNSTYFSPEVARSPDGRLTRLTIRGLGYGHGVGMCQWGAVGRARAGQDFRTILRTYYPGTTVARAY